MPRTRGSFRVHVSELDLAVEGDTPLTDFAEPHCGEVETRIGAHVAALVRDGDTLQFGIGSVPVALAGALTSHRRLRVHGGMVSAALRMLWEAGALDRDARIFTTGVVLGDAGFHDFAARLDPLWLTDVAHSHDVRAIAASCRVSFAINDRGRSPGPVRPGECRASGAGVIQAGAGGLPAFATGALRVARRQAAVCLGSTARKGSVSRIVPALDAQALCTLPRYLADTVVTEHGAAELRRLSLEARAQALIAIAAPEHRAVLAQAWDEIRRSA